MLALVREQVQAALDSGALVRCHGNGMLQLDLEGEQRLHVWGHPGIPRQRVRTPIHDHTFDFESHVLVGRLFNVRYMETFSTATRAPVYRVYSPVARVGQDTELLDTGEEARVRVYECQLLGEGECYQERAGDLHETLSDVPTATLMRKTARLPGAAARVLVPLGLEPDNEFDRNAHSSELLVSVVWEVLGAPLDA